MLTTLGKIDYSYLNQLVGHLTGLAHLRATQLCTEALAEIDLTPKQFVTLEFIANNPSLSQKEIAQYVGTPPAVLVGILDTLTKRGFVKRIRSEEDRRRHSVSVTSAGEAARTDIRKAALVVEARLLQESNLSDTEWDMLILLLQKLTHREETL